MSLLLFEISLTRRTMNFVNHKRSFFDPLNVSNLPNFKLSVWPGYNTSIDRFDGGVLLQCDVAHRILRTETVRDFICSKATRGILSIEHLHIVGIEYHRLITCSI